MTATAKISTLMDLRNWVLTYIDPMATMADAEVVIRKIQMDANRPAWGADWRKYLDGLPENLLEMAES